eukprot:6200879-Pleurochrysis_carterae.AAC.1
MSHTHLGPNVSFASNLPACDADTERLIAKSKFKLLQLHDINASRPRNDEGTRTPGAASYTQVAACVGASGPIPDRRSD